MPQPPTTGSKSSPNRPYAERSRHPLSTPSQKICVVFFAPPIPTTSAGIWKIPSISDPKFAVRQPLKTPPILVSHRLREPIVQWATLAYPPSPSGGHLWRGDGPPPPLFCTPLLPPPSHASCRLCDVTGPLGEFRPCRRHVSLPIASDRCKSGPEWVHEINN